MSQKYTEVEWTDETPTEPGTLINKARLDQMQSAHHYADGFEEVDTIPAADPGVDYHKVVYCTADSTFYRWDGSQWTKDIDDETKALLLAHEADHSNPHVVTKAQVGLGDVVDKGMDDAPTDSSDNYVKSGGVKTALDGKLNVVPTTAGTYFYAQQSTGPTRYQGSTNATTGATTVVLRETTGRISCTDPVGASNAANKKYVDACLTDGSVTKVGTADVGSDLKPIKLVAGVPTAVTNDLVDTIRNQDIDGIKTLLAGPIVKCNSPSIQLLDTEEQVSATPASGTVATLGFADKDGNSTASLVTLHSTAGERKTFLATVGQSGAQATLDMIVKADGTKYMTGPSRAYNASNTTDIVTLALLDQYAPMVRTTNAQTIGGAKTLTDNLTIYKGTPSLKLKDGIAVWDTAPASNRYMSVDFLDKNAAGEGSIACGHYTNGLKEIYASLKGQDGTNHALRMYATANGMGYVTAPARTYNTANTNDVVTIGTLKASTDVVHTSGAETIDGNKTFSGNIIKTATSGGLVIQSTDQTQTSPPSANRFLTLAISGSNNTDLGTYGLACRSNGNREAYIQAFNADGTAETLRMYALANGAGYMTGPARAYNAANTTDVVTISLLDGYTPMVRTSGNQNVGGIKTIPETVIGTKMVNRVATTHALEVLQVDASSGAGLTYLFHLIVSGRFDLELMRVAVALNSSGQVATVTTTAMGIFALSNTRQIVAGARVNDGILKLSLRAKSGNTSISAMPMNCNVDGITYTMDLTPYGNVTTIANMTGYVEEA